MKKIFILVCITIISFNAKSYYNFDFSAICNTGQTLYYKIYGNNTVGVTYPQYGEHNYGYYYYDGFSEPTGHVIIPDSVLYNSVWYKVTKITNCAFRGCTGLTSVTIPNSVTSIGEEAFWCTGLTSVTIPNSVTSIGSSAFSGCTGLTSITIPNSVTSIGSSAFIGCTSLTSITIPNSVASIGESAFYNCTGLTSVTIPNSVTSIGSSAFSGCTGLTSITIPNSVTSIGSSAFIGCTGLTSITIPNSVTSIEDYTFFNCTNLTSITLPNSVTSIGKDAFQGCTGLTSVIIPNSVTSIGNYAFSNCINLISIEIGKDLTYMGSYVFKNCNNISVVEWNAKNCVAYNDAFVDKTNISILNIGDSVIKIPNNFVKQCSGLIFVTVGENVSNIGNSAFADCNNIDVLNWNAKNCIIYNDAFVNKINITVLNIGDSVEIIPNNFLKGCTKLPSVILPPSVAHIGYSAFENCIKLKIPILPDSLSYVGNNAFRKCRLLDNRLVIPQNVNYIGNYAFDSCSLISSIVMKGNPPTIFANTFNTISNSTPIFVPCGKVDDYYAVYFWSNFTNIQESQPYEFEVFSEDTIKGIVNIIKTPTCSDNNAKILALNNNGYIFSSWSDGSNDNPKEFTVYSDTILTAYFVPITPIISVVSNDSTKGLVTGSGEYVYMQSINISATAKSYYHFVSWNDGNTENPRTIIVTQDSSFTAIFISDTCDVFVISNNELAGNVYGGGTFLYQNTITISATPNEHYHFVSWNDGSTQNPRQITVEQDTSFVALFEIDTHFVATGVNDESYGQVTDGSVYDYGTPITLTANATTGYHFTQWNDGNTENPRNIIVTQDTSFVAWFEIDTFFVDVSANDVSFGSTSGSGVYDWSSEVVISATPNEHYHFVQWQDGNTSNPRLVTITKDTSFVAIFQEDTRYTLQVVSNNQTMGTVEGAGEYYEGETISIKATANEHYHFSQWSDGNTDNPRLVTVISDNTFIANFVKDIYTVSVESENVTMGTVYGAGEYEYQDVVEIYAVAYAGYKFLQWNDENTDNPRQINVLQNATYIANFIIDDGVGLEAKEKEDIVVTLYPNPTTSNATLLVKGLTEEATIMVTDQAGRVISTTTLALGQETMEVETSTLASGVYYVRIQTANSVRTEKLIKNN